MKQQFINKHFCTQSAKAKALKKLGVKTKTHAEFISVLQKLSYSQLKQLL